MRLPWKKSSADQLDLLDARPKAPGQSTLPSTDESASIAVREQEAHASQAKSAPTEARGLPLVVPIALIDEDPNNPRTEFPDTEIDELADDIRQHGILQPLIVHPADARGRYRIHFGAKRWRAAQRAGLAEVPTVVLDMPADPYSQIAENQKRHGLTPLDLARFIRSRVDQGESNAFIGRRMGMNLTTVAHHLSLLELPPELDQALKSGRCTSPRTLHELSKLHAVEPGKVRALVGGEGEITRNVVTAMKPERPEPARVAKVSAQADVIARANAACDRLERALAHVGQAAGVTAALPDLMALRTRVESLAKSWPQGSDGQTSRHADHRR
ncbi:MAG: ParB/RepB/Spo0J family partition protein [Burkholderiaceae bacterium]|nr:ParB/RepB/Spo0J family partition protein [Burkholderiaceae bacterium]